MTDLSPAAQAISDAYENNLSSYIETGLIAALRELADQLRLERSLGDTDADAGVFATHQAIYRYLRDIATELEGQ